MQTEKTINRAKKIDESLEIIAKIEEVVGIPLTDSRRALQVAGEYVTDDSMFVEQMVQAMTEAAGFAIETGHDDLASDAIQNVTDLETLVSDDD
ncbi:hypothetical protein HALDL1_03665 [Halobacterium sp. DL1]|jgi:hypothetical protein|uniref:Uncharacterized protein n=1 Tax=Halorubrum lacusprofundi (strain ATCC 49239 / DSM 5036 / JCM 8891 / ACAM 34) TaxID=416348 RepID=B9LVU1_HALLT|nr:hypothetical protein [Halorubrum lacusprofundi]ACM58331.1 hypothetical protein Hlac_2760 [Halorubrum lacusprofundi ATCC 49239]AEN07416.1 hypothetical protein Halar_0149 [halophilic archaeon DL31]AHG02825.1 hypothetical protein HALDL1_03665 [Halobacterium sp. DL1]